MAIRVICKENAPISSNCYIVYDSAKSLNCMIIDPGTEDNSNILSTLSQLNLQPEYVLLTHEHFDHIWGVNDLRIRFPKIQLICSESCADRIRHAKKNCSLFYDQIGFSIVGVDILTEKCDTPFCWQNYLIEFKTTEGHSPASICILIDKELFTGDTLLKEEQTVTKLPGGDRHKLQETLNYFESLKGRRLHVRPGHGEGFSLDTYHLEKAMNFS